MIGDGPLKIHHHYLYVPGLQDFQPKFYWFPVDSKLLWVHLLYLEGEFIWRCLRNNCRRDSYFDHFIIFDPGCFNYGFIRNCQNLYRYFQYPNYYYYYFKTSNVPKFTSYFWDSDHAKTSVFALCFGLFLLGFETLWNCGLDFHFFHLFEIIIYLILQNLYALF